jgi:ABC-type uncharacterized transport system substrate-binding protein
MLQALSQTFFLADKILTGAKPADFLVQQPTKFELAVNVKTAKVCGVKFSNSILARTANVIQAVQCPMNCGPAA